MINYTNPNRPTEDSHLVERVRWAIGNAEVESFDVPDWTDEALAAIREVSAWLNNHQYWENASAVLEAELEDFAKINTTSRGTLP